ncbi:hypothetical protein ISCGN_016376 [Ixodes scapularis]
MEELGNRASSPTKCEEGLLFKYFVNFLIHLKNEHLGPAESILKDGLDVLEVQGQHQGMDSGGGGASGRGRPQARAGAAARDSSHLRKDRTQGRSSNQGGTCENRCLESGVSTDPEPCGFARPRLAVRGFPVSGEKGILVVESNPGQASKRPCPEQVIAKAPETEHFVKFFVVHSEDNQRPAAKLSPFIVAKVLEHLIGHSYQAKKLHSGDLLVEVITQEQSVAIQKMKSIVETSVTVTPHRTLNTVRGVISEEDLLDVSEDEILEGLRNSGVIAVKRIILRREGAKGSGMGPGAAVEERSAPSVAATNMSQTSVKALCAAPTAKAPMQRTPVPVPCGSRKRRY